MTSEKQKDVVIREEGLQGLIYPVRGMQVMLDSDLAELYGVPVKRLNEQVKRNVDRFPKQFRFQLTKEEFENLRCQFGTSSQASQNAIPENGSLRSQTATLESGPGQHRKYLPYVFTEQGVAMLSAVLRGETAVAISIEPEDLELSPFNQRGGLGKAHQLFGDQLATLLEELDEVLAA